MAEQHTGDSAGDMPTPGRLVLAPAVRAVAGTACSVLPLRSPTGLAPPTTLSQSRRGRPVSHAGRLPPRGLGLPLPENGELAAPGRWVLQKPLLDGLLSTPSRSQWSASHVDSPLRCGRPSPSAAGTPQAVHAEAWGGAPQTPAGVDLGCCCPPTAAAHGPTCTLLRKRPACKIRMFLCAQHRTGSGSCMLPVPLELSLD